MEEWCGCIGGDSSVVDVTATMVDEELLEGMSGRFEARRRANRTRIRMTVATKRKPPIQPTMIIARLFLFGDCEEADVVALA